MKKSTFALLILLGLAGCQVWEQTASHTLSSISGLNRTVRLYDANGGLIGIWKGRYNIEMDHGAVRFIDKGKAIIIQGTYVVEEN
jgi:hypothetical protein